jgi:hypothetical protein
MDECLCCRLYLCVRAVARNKLKIVTIGNGQQGKHKTMPESATIAEWGDN